MTLLRRTLKTGAGVQLVIGLALGLFPFFVLVRILDQAPMTEYVWVRLFALTIVVLAMFHILVAQNLKEVWWWSWGFAAMDAGVATLCILNALFGLPPDSAAWPWWLFGLAALGFTILYLVGLARAGQEKPFA
jgi:hypothetical protein